MLTKATRWIFIGMAVLLGVIFSMTSPSLRVSADDGVEPVSNSCLSCHTDLYYLYDSGKLYCLTEHTDRCVNCHEGNQAVMKKEASHFGLVAHPQENGGEKCLECHTDRETQDRLIKFSSEGGFDAVIRANPYTPIPDATVEFPEKAEVSPLVENWPWLVGALTLFGFWLILVLISPLKP